MSARIERVLLLMAVGPMPDVDNVLTWRVDGRSPTAEEVPVLQAITIQDAMDVSVLHRLDIELGCWQ